MRFFTLGLLMLFGACNHQSTTKINGVIQHQLTDEVIITNGLFNYKDTFKIVDGCFKGSIVIDKPGLYSLKNGNYDLELYLKPEEDVTLDLDILSIKNGRFKEVKFIGLGSEENALMMDLQARNYEIMKSYAEWCVLSPDSFERFIEEHYMGVRGVIESFERKGTSRRYFYEIMELISAIKLSETYMYYTSYHNHIASNNNFLIPEKFYGVGADIKLDNKMFYKEVSAYRNYVLKKHEREMTKKIKKAGYRHGSIHEANAQLDFIQSLKVRQEVKDDLCKRIISKYGTASFVVKKIYKDRYAEIMKNEAYVADFKLLLAKLERLKSGKMAPSFSYKDINENLVSLEDLRGKIVYVDVWATWCAPCMKEVKHLKQLEEDLDELDIAFVSISIDKDEEVWKKMVNKKEMKGYQLYADGERQSAIMKAYEIKGIPRFIIIDKEGKLVNVKANRPSSGDLIKTQLMKLAM